MTNKNIDFLKSRLLSISEEGLKETEGETPFEKAHSEFVKREEILEKVQTMKEHLAQNSQSVN